MSNDGFNIFSFNTLYGKHDAEKHLRERERVTEYMSKSDRINIMGEKRERNIPGEYRKNMLKKNKKKKKNNRSINVMSKANREKKRTISLNSSIQQRLSP